MLQVASTFRQLTPTVQRLLRVHRRSWVLAVLEKKAPCRPKNPSRKRYRQGSNRILNQRFHARRVHGRLFNVPSHFRRKMRHHLKKSSIFHFSFSIFSFHLQPYLFTYSFRLFEDIELMTTTTTTTTTENKPSVRPRRSPPKFGLQVSAPFSGSDKQI